MRVSTLLFALLLAAPAAEALTALEKACARIATQVPLTDPRALLAHAIGQALDMDSVRARLEELSGVMWAAGGVNRPADGRLTAPSALALYPVRVYAFFAEGVYSYDAKARKLVRVAEGDLRRLAGARAVILRFSPQTGA